MKRYENILVAFDGSLDSMEALQTAETIAKDNHSHLTVAYVHDGPLEYPVSIGTTPVGDPYLFQVQSYVTPGVTTNVPPIPEEQEYTVVEDNMPKQVMSQAQKKLSGELPVTYEKLIGKPAEEINNYAKNNDMDLIVIGSRGLSGIKKFVMGSVSEKVTDQAECSVCVVK